MGQLKLFCVASDGRSLYGLSSGTNLDSGTKDPLVILVKSNSDPSALAQVSWSVVSTVRIGAIFDITQSQSHQACSVDDKGVFTYIGQNVIKAPSTTGVKAGVQFSPSFPPNSGGSSTGTGGWKTIEIPATYTWQETTNSEVLFSVLDSTGTANTVVHAFIGSGNTGVQFGTLDSSSMQLKQGPLWATADKIDKLDFHSSSLYFLTRGSGTAGTNLTMSSVPIGNSAIAAAMPTTGGRSYNVRSVATFYDPSWCRSGFVTNTFFIACGQLAQSIATMDISIGTMGMYNRLASSIPEGRMDAFQPIGGYNGEAGFVFMQVTDTVSDKSSLYGMIVQGGQVGQWQRVDYQANVTENVGYGSPTGPTTSSGGAGSSSTGLIVGCVLGVLVLVAAAAYFGYYRRVVLKRKTGDKQVKEQQQDAAAAGMNGGNPSHDNIFIKGGGNPSHDNILIKGGGFQLGKFPVNPTELDAIELQKRPYDPRHDGPGSTTTTSLHYPPSIYPVSTFTTTPFSSTPTTAVLPEPPRQQQQFRLTSHPRPNFITSVSAPVDMEHGNESKTALTSGTITRASSSTLPAPKIPHRPTGLSSGTILPQIPTSTRPKITTNHPHSILTNGPAVAGPTSSPQEIISSNTLASIPWEQPVVHNPHTEPLISPEEHLFP